VISFSVEKYAIVVFIPFIC